MATPIVAGRDAFYWGKHPTATASAVKTALTSTGKTVSDYNGFPSDEKRVDLMKANSVSATGFVGLAYNGQTGIKLAGATVTVKSGATTIGTTTTDNTGFFSYSGLTGGTTYTLVFSKTGFSSYTTTAVAVGGYMTDLIKPVFLNQTRATGQWSVVIDWRTFQPGYTESTWTYSSIPAWSPYNWNTVAGTFMAPYVKSSTLGTIELDEDYRGSLTESPKMALTTNPYDNGYAPVSTFVIKPQSGQTYKVYTRLDNINDSYYEWGKYKTVSGATDPRIQARVYLAGTLKGTVNASSATGSGAYWYIGTISGSTFTLKNLLQTTAP